MDLKGRRSRDGPDGERQDLHFDDERDERNWIEAERARRVIEGKRCTEKKTENLKRVCQGVKCVKKRGC